MTFNSEILSSIRVSSRNIALLDRRKSNSICSRKSESLRSDSNLDPRSVTCEELGYKGLVESTSCFLLFFVRGKAVRNMITDYEYHRSFQSFLNMIEKDSSCYEASFGLANLLAQEAKYARALDHIQLALKTRKDVLFLLWEGTLRLKLLADDKPEALRIFKLFEFVLKINHKCIEALWGMMKLSIKGILLKGKEIDCAKYYASKIKSIDSYYGYLA